MTRPAAIEPAAPPARLMISCLAGSNEVRAVRPGALDDSGAQRQEAICCADRATDQTRTS